MLVVAGTVGAAPTQTAGSEDPPQATVYLDLALPSPMPLAVPAGTYLDVHLRNAAPSALYRVSMGTRGLPATRFELPKPFDVVRSFSARSGCGDLTRQAVSLLSLAEESAIAARVPPLEQSAARPSCQGEDLVIRETIKQTRPSLRGLYQLTPGEELVVTVERVSRESNQVLKSWTATFRGGAPDVGWRFATEQAWVMHEVVEAIADMAFFATHHGAPSPADVDVAVEAAPQPGVFAPRFQVRVRAGATAQIVAAQPHVWSPATYETLARGFLSAPKPATGPPAPPVLDALLNLQGPVIEAESRRVSERVTAHPLDSSAHEQAALVLGAFGLREAAGTYGELRPTLNRMTAHSRLRPCAARPGAAGTRWAPGRDRPLHARRPAA